MRYPDAPFLRRQTRDTLRQAEGDPGRMGFLDTAAAWARALKRDVVAVWIAARDRRTPMHARLAAGAVAAYALSPIDLIPDFIPVLGYLDDLVIVPLGIWLVVKLIPPPLMAEFRAHALRTARPRSLAGLAAMVVIWLTLTAILGWWLWSLLSTQGT